MAGETKKTTVKKDTAVKDTKKIEKSKEVKKAKKTDERISKIIEEQLGNLDKAETVKTVKKTSKKKEIKHEELDEKEISKKIELSKKMPKEQKSEIYKSIFTNLMVAIVITIYFIVLNFGYMNIEDSSYISDLKVFSIGLIAITITLFEYAYNKDNGKIAIFGIETLCLAIVTLISMYIYILYKDKFLIMVGICSDIAIIYYSVKSISIKIREEKQWKKSISDVKEIMKEE